MAKKKFKKKHIGLPAYIVGDEFKSIGYRHGQEVLLVGIIPAGHANFDGEQNTPVVCGSSNNAKPFTVRSDLLTLSAEAVEE